jgi:hypothetical protein
MWLVSYKQLSLALDFSRSLELFKNTINTINNNIIIIHANHFK